MPRFVQTFDSAIRKGQPGLGNRLVRAAFWWLSIPYCIGVWFRNRHFDRNPNRAVRVPIPVISIGNLTLGGTGKTPAVEFFARHLQNRDRQVAILSRGYGNDIGPNDEALLLEENLPDVPHLQGRDRVALATMALEELESEVLLLDDGFQHRRLHRNFDIVLIDATRNIFDEYMFPRGLLREPVTSLKRADAVILTRCDQTTTDNVQVLAAELNRRFPQLIVASARHSTLELIREGKSPLDPSDLRGRAVLAFCGIGNPEAFQRTLLDLGAKVIGFRPFADHHKYTRDDVASLTSWAATFPVETVVLTTQKDFVKLRTPDFAERPLLALRIEFAFHSGESELLTRLDSMLPESINS